MPALPGYSQGLRRAGPYGGYLGSRYDPWLTQGDPNLPGYHVPDLQPMPGSGGGTPSCTPSRPVPPKDGIRKGCPPSNEANVVSGIHRRGHQVVP